MITRIEALNFRCLRHVSQSISRFQMLVGPNGAGKSAFLDVVAFLGDLLKVGPHKATTGDGETIPARASDPRHLCWMRQEARFELAIEADIPPERAAKLPNGRYKKARYEVAIDAGGVNPGEEMRLASETFWLTPGTEGSTHQERTLFPMKCKPPHALVRESSKHAPPGWRKVVTKISASGNDYFHAETSGWNNPFRLGPTKSALANLPEDEDRFPVATWFKRFLMEGVQRITLNAQAMRRPSPPGLPRRFLADGSNLPWVIDTLCRSDPTRFSQWLDHVRTAIADIRNIKTVERPEDRHRYLVVEYENDLVAPSWVVSDGTLRMLALTLLAYTCDAESVFLIEEPENGVHPRATESVYQSLSSIYEAQVLCASHSPVILGLAKANDLLCFAKDERGATDIVCGEDHPRLRGWQGTLDLGTMFAAGVLG